MDNLLSKGYEFILGYETKVFAISIGYRNHNFVFRQHNTSLDSVSGYGISAKYHYKIESIPIRWRYMLSRNMKNSIVMDFGFSLNRENFIKVDIENSPSHSYPTHLAKYEKSFNSVNGSLGVIYERQINRNISIGCTVEAMIDFTKGYFYFPRSQMAPKGKFLYPFDWKPYHDLNSVFLKYSLKSNNRLK